METWLWLKFSSGQLFSAHKLVNGAACGCFAPWGKKRIVVTHWLCWCISGHFKSDLDTSELIPLPNIIIREMSIVTMWKVVANIRNILNKMWGKSAMRAKRGRVEALNWEKWKEKKWLTKNQRKRKKDWQPAEGKVELTGSFYILEGADELDQLLTFSKLAIGHLHWIRVDHRTQWEGRRKIQKIMFYTSLLSKLSQVHNSSSYLFPNKNK